MQEMYNGHFSMSHASFGEDSAIMQENKTVKQWREENQAIITSSYSGYVYDAVWVYALALDKLIRESPDYMADLHSDRTTKRLIELISATDFSGVSGPMQFGEGGSRFSNITLRQWINGEARLVGTFQPNITESNGSRKRSIEGGNLKINMSNIVWLYENGIIPTDGTEVCSVAVLANIFGIECTTAVYIITTSMCLILVVGISIASFMFWKRQYDKKLKQSAKVMRNFGIDLLSPSSIPSNTLDKWEVSKDRVVINRRLGEGAFGTVYGGEAQINENGWTAVAVKTLKKGSSTEDRLDFLSEAEAMKRFDHSNVVKLLGVCLQTEPIYTIMEFMLYGDLKTFLLARRHLVGEKISDDSDVATKRLTVMALDVARALSYLADMKYVHRDVACRNCLVNAQRVVKLGDFGMARPMFENDYYKFNRKGMLPVRWMAPESLGLGIFTPASDVWSFGVLLYEIITFGSFPFQGLTNNQVLDHLKNGHTLVIPNGVKPQLEGLMKACWNSSYKKRPSASEVAEFISNYPRLVTPSLDVPLASVQMPESDSDQLELLPGLRKRLTQPSNGMSKSSTFNTFDGIASTLPNGITLREFNVPNDDDITQSTHGVTSNAYNPIEPLLQCDTEISSSNLSLRRYVPMCGFKRSNRSLAMESTSAI